MPSGHDGLPVILAQGKLDSKTMHVWGLWASLRRPASKDKVGEQWRMTPWECPHAYSHETGRGDQQSDHLFLHQLHLSIPSPQACSPVCTWDHRDLPASMANGTEGFSLIPVYPSTMSSSQVLTSPVTDLHLPWECISIHSSKLMASRWEVMWLREVLGDIQAAHPCSQRQFGTGEPGSSSR